MLTSLLGLHFVWSLWFSQKPIIFEDAREGFERLIKALKNHQSTVVGLHGDTEGYILVLWSKTGL